MLSLFAVALLIVFLCGGSGVMLQQLVHVVERPFVPAESLPKVVRLPDPVDPTPTVRPVPTPRPRPIARPRPIVRPQPVVPAPEEPVEPEPVQAEPVIEPARPETASDVQITLQGDASEVRIRGEGVDEALPASVPPGTYALWATIDGRTFDAGSILVLDGTPRNVICSVALGLCKVR